MIIAILSIVIVLFISLLGFLIHMAYNWRCNVDNVPFAVYITLIVFTSIVILMSASLLVIQLVKIL